MFDYFYMKEKERTASFSTHFRIYFQNEYKHELCEQRSAAHMGRALPFIFIIRCYHFIE